MALITFILITGDHPFASQGSNPNLSMICKSIHDFDIGQMRLKYADWVWKGSNATVSPAARDFVEKVGNEFPDRRLTVKEALQHPFITRKVVLNRPITI